MKFVLDNLHSTFIQGTNDTPHFIKRSHVNLGVCVCVCVRILINSLDNKVLYLLAVVEAGHALIFLTPGLAHSRNTTFLGE